MNNKTEKRIYEGYRENSVVTFDLITDKNQTILVLTHRILREFPVDIPEFTWKNCHAGWTFFIKQGPKAYLDSTF